jgi:hypothetical protein
MMMANALIQTSVQIQSVAPMKNGEHVVDVAEHVQILTLNARRTVLKCVSVSKDIFEMQTDNVFYHPIVSHSSVRRILIGYLVETVGMNAMTVKP